MKKTISYQPLKSALVALDLTEMDDYLIQYAALLNGILPLERIFFVHAAKDLELPKDLLEEYPDLVQPLDESIEADILRKVKQYFNTTYTEINCIIQEGSPIETILKLCKVKNIDLVLMGRKKSLRGSGIVSSRIARKCPCSLMLITEDFPLAIQKVLLPLDFSPHSGLAAKLGWDVHQKTQAELLAVHMYSVPTGYHTTGKSYQEFANIMKGHAEKAYQKFLAKHEIPDEVPCEFVLTRDGKYSDLTYNLAEEKQVDLIIIGSKGRTSAASVLMGSVSEKLVYLDSHIPVLIVKSKGENMSFLDALLKV
ncbi:MAG: universal stress protein [Bacteroidota bacterium]